MKGKYYDKEQGFKHTFDQIIIAHTHSRLNYRAKKLSAQLGRIWQDPPLHLWTSSGHAHRLSNRIKVQEV